MESRTNPASTGAPLLELVLLLEVVVPLELVLALDVVPPLELVLAADERVAPELEEVAVDAGPVVLLELVAAEVLEPVPEEAAVELVAARVFEPAPEEAAVELVAAALVPPGAKHWGDSSQVAMPGQPSERNTTVQHPEHEAHGLVIAHEPPELPVLEVVVAVAVVPAAAAVVEAVSTRAPGGGLKHAAAISRSPTEKELLIAAE